MTRDPPDFGPVTTGKSHLRSQCLCRLVLDIILVLFT